MASAGLAFMFMLKAGRREDSTRNIYPIFQKSKFPKLCYMDTYMKKDAGIVGIWWQARLWHHWVFLKQHSSMTGFMRFKRQLWQPWQEENCVFQSLAISYAATKRLCPSSINGFLNLDHLEWPPDPFPSWLLQRQKHPWQACSIVLFWEFLEAQPRVCSPVHSFVNI